MAAGALAAGLAGGLSMFGNYLNNEYAQQQAAQQYAYDTEAWWRTQAYNSPAAQMQRFRDAGLNANLIYGQQNVANSAYPSQTAALRHADFSQAANILSQVDTLGRVSQEAQSWIKTIQQIKESQSRMEKNQSQVALNDIRKDLDTLKYGSFRSGDYFGKLVDNLAKRNFVLKLSSDIKQNEFDFLSRTLDSRVAAIDLQNELLGSRKKLLDEQTSNQSVLRDLWRSTAALQRQKRLSEVENTYWLKNRSFRANRYWDSMVGNMSQKGALMKAQEEFYGMRSAFTELKTQLLPIEIGISAFGALSKSIIDGYKAATNARYQDKTIGLKARPDAGLKVR